MFNKKTTAKKSGFTLIELLVVISIIGILSTLSIVALQGARGRARDAKRITDVRQIQTALELYFNDAGGYPATVVAGSPIYFGSSTFMYSAPSGPTPADGDCATSSYVYTQLDSGADYYLEFCLGGRVADMDAGIKCAFSGGMISTTTACY